MINDVIMIQKVGQEKQKKEGIFHPKALRVFNEEKNIKSLPCLSIKRAVCGKQNFYASKAEIESNLL